MSGVIIVGAGPGIGASLATRAARDDLAVGVIARSEATVDAVLAAITDADALGVTADVTDEAGLRTALDEIVARFGPPELLVYNAAVIRQDRIGELTARQQLDAWAVNVVGAITAVAHVAPAMIRAGGGTVLLTGGMPEPAPEVTSLSLGKAGVRTLTVLLDKTYRSNGLHVATVTVADAVVPGGAFDPDAIAEHYWRLHRQPAGHWDREFVFTGEPAKSPSTTPPRVTGSPATAPVTVLLVPGSNRTGSTNLAVLRTAARISGGATPTELFQGLLQLPLFTPDDDADGGAVPPVVAEMRGGIRRADAVLICTPEYAGALPAALKNVLEWTIGDGSLDRKPVAWINAAGPAAPTGGADAHGSLEKVLRYAGADIVDEACARIPIARSMVDDSGLIGDESVHDQIRGVLERLADHVAQTRSPR
jgi:NAD(P)H-dependent FMN reductase/NADP-dependent 3-hydroxy acid dehydrogenase YdfG